MNLVKPKLTDAQKVLEQLHSTDGTSSRLNIDWLSFSFKIVNLRHCARAGFLGFTHETQSSGNETQDDINNFSVSSTGRSDVMKDNSLFL